MDIIGENIHIISEKVKEALAARDREFFMDLAVNSSGDNIEGPIFYGFIRLVRRLSQKVCLAELVFNLVHDPGVELLAGRLRQFCIKRGLPVTCIA